MKTVLLITSFFFSITALASGPSDSIFEPISSTARRINPSDYSLTCKMNTQTDGSQIGSAQLTLTNLGKQNESVTLTATPLQSCDLVHSNNIIQVNFADYQASPIHWNGEVTGQPYETCVVSATLASGVTLTAWYWTPRDSSACQTE